MPLAAVLIVGATAVGVYKNHSATQSAKNSETNQTMITEEKSYDPNAKPLTDADIDLLIKDASAESPADADEEKDSDLVTVDKDSLNNFDNVYVATDF